MINKIISLIITTAFQLKFVIHYSLFNIRYYRGPPRGLGFRWHFSQRANKKLLYIPTKEGSHIIGELLVWATRYLGWYRSPASFSSPGLFAYFLVLQKVGLRRKNLDFLVLFDQVEDPPTGGQKGQKSSLFSPAKSRSPKGIFESFLSGKTGRQRHFSQRRNDLTN